MLVCLVDDSEDDAFFTKKKLSELDSNLEIEWQQDSEAFLVYLDELAPENLPELIILDVRMPRLDGFDILKIIRQQERYQTIPILMFSSTDSEQEREQAKQLGANDFYTKPIDFARFRDTVHTLYYQWLAPR